MMGFLEHASATEFLSSVRFGSVRGARRQTARWHVHGCVGKAVSPRRRVVTRSSVVIGASGNTQGAQKSQSVCVCVGRLSFGFLWVSDCSTRSSRISPEFHQDSTESHHNFELEHLQQGDDHNSAFPQKCANFLSHAKSCAGGGKSSRRTQQPSSRWCEV